MRIGFVNQSVTATQHIMLTSCPARAGIILAYSNSVAGRLSDMTLQLNAGNVGCFFGGTVATLLSGAALLAFTRFGSLGDEAALTTQQKPKKA